MDSTVSDVNNSDSTSMSDQSTDNTNTVDNQQDNSNSENTNQNSNFDRQNSNNKGQNKTDTVPYQRFQEVNKKVQDYKRKSEELEKKLQALSLQEKKPVEQKAANSNTTTNNGFDLNKEVSDLLKDISDPQLKDKYENYNDLARDLRKDLINVLVSINQKDIAKKAQQQDQIRQQRNIQVSQIRQILGNDQAKLDEFIDYANKYLSSKPNNGLYEDLRDVFMNYSKKYLTATQSQQAKDLTNKNNTSAISKTRTPASNLPKGPSVRDIRNRSFDELKDMGRNSLS